MTLLVLVILAVIWAAVLLPPYLQGRSNSRPADSISSFQKQLSVLEHRANGVTPRAGSRSTSRQPGALRPVATRYAPSSLSASGAHLNRAEAKKRRRDVLFTLAGSVGITFVMSLVLGGPVWGLQLACDALLGGYVYLLVQLTQQAGERDNKVRYLPARQARADETQLLLRRSGS
ncbi:MAG: hypothetical protein ACR2LQ_00130 [Acidimicrobiales bacterium]